VRTNTLKQKQHTLFLFAPHPFQSSRRRKRIAPDSEEEELAPRPSFLSGNPCPCPCLFHSTNLKKKIQEPDHFCLRFRFFFFFLLFGLLLPAPPFHFFCFVLALPTPLPPATSNNIPADKVDFYC